MTVTDNKHKTRSRRHFLAGLAAGAAGGFVASRTGTLPFLSFTAEPDWQQEADVVVVGGGASGCTAALSAAQAGAKVILLEAAPVLGGAGSLCIGSITVPLSSLQKQAGIKDSIDDFIADILKLMGTQASRMDLQLLQLLAANGGATIDWLLSLGVDIRGPFAYPAHRVHRMHMLVPKSAEWPKVLRPSLERYGVRILMATKGVELYRNANGPVIGVKALDQRTQQTFGIRAKRSVMLTAGNLEANPRLTARATTPEVAALQPAVYSRDGSGFTMAWAVGSATTNIDGGIVNPQIRGMPPAPAVFSLKKQSWMPFSMVDAGAILVNKRGERFGDELDAGPALSLALEKQPFKTCYLIFDKRVADIFNKWPMVVGSSPGIAAVSKLGGWALVDDLIARQGIKKAETLEALAGAIGVEASGLRAGIEKWNAACKTGHDAALQRATFGHEGAGTARAGILVPPFYCHGPLKTWLMPADTSLAINAQFQVLDVFGKVIPGLYAGGDMGHGDMATSGTGHGINMGWAFTSGRLGGKLAAAQASLA